MDLAAAGWRRDTVLASDGSIRGGGGLGTTLGRLWGSLRGSIPNCAALSGRLRNFPPILACKTMSTTGSAACLIQVNAACSEEPAQQASSGTYPVVAAVR